MSNIKVSVKKYCPYCFYTKETNETHCPNVATMVRLHNYRLSVPLEVCKPDTTNSHKYAKRRVPDDDLNKINDLHNKQIAAHGGLKMRIQDIRRLQRKARFEGKINDGQQIDMDR